MEMKTNEAILKVKRCLFPVSKVLTPDLKISGCVWDNGREGRETREFHR